MNSKNVFPIKDEKIPCTCVKCLKEFDKEKLHIIHIPPMGYGSGFDLTDVVFILCDDCYKESIKNNPELWSMKTEVYTVHYYKNDNLSVEEREKNKVDVISTDEFLVPIDMQNDVVYTEDFESAFSKYIYEEEMLNYFDNLPLVGAEVVMNRLWAHHCSLHPSDPQEWIDYQLGELPYEQCKKNHWVSPEEIKSYQVFFGRCVHVKNIIYSDGSRDCHCFINRRVTGKYGGKCSSAGVGCYKCEHFKEREGDVETIKINVDNAYELLKSLYEKEKNS